MTAFKIAVAPVGRLEVAEIEAAAARAAKVLREPLELRAALAVPHGSEAAERGQHRAAELLEALAAEARKLGPGRLVGARDEGQKAPPTPGVWLFVTDVDLFTAKTDGVFAALISAKKCAVVSLRRLREAFHRRPADPNRQRARLVKELLRMAGRMQGAAECADPSCVMSASKSVHDIDAKEERFCRICEQRLFEGRVQLMSDWLERAHEVVVVILGGGRGSRLDPLTRFRSKPAVPFAGKYRLIDIPISNAIHSNMERMLLLTQYNSISLHRHIVSTYKFDMFSRGFVQILAAQQTMSDEKWFQGTADAVRQNLPMINDLRGEHVLILSGDHLYRMDYRQMLRDHLEHDADVTLAVMPSSEEEIGQFGAVRIDATGRIVEFREKPKDAEGRAGMRVAPDLLRERELAEDRPYLASMGIYLFRKRVLTEILANEWSDFGHHVLPAAVDQVHVQAHFFKGYWRDIGTIRAYYDAHMDLLEPKAPFDFYDDDWPFYTHPRYLPGSRLTGCSFHRTLLAGGGVVSDSTVERSVIGVRTIMREATVRRTLILGGDPFRDTAPPDAPPVGISRGSVIEDAIIDKNVRIGCNVTIKNEAGLREGQGPYHVIRDGIIVVPHNTIIPDGTVIP